MSLPDPQELQMVLDLKAALLTIAILSGFYHDVAAEAVKLDANADIETLIGENQQRPFILVNVLPETRSYSPAKRVDVTTPIDIHFVQEPTDPDDETRLRTYLCGCADIEKAIALDVSRGGHAIDTVVLSHELLPLSGSSLVWAVIHTQVRSRRVYGAP
jgi:hypothetical protein